MMIYTDVLQILINFSFGFFYNLHKHSLSVMVSSAALYGIVFWTLWPLIFQSLYSFGKFGWISLVKEKKNQPKPKKQTKKKHRWKRLFTVSPLHEFSNCLIANISTGTSCKRKKSPDRGMRGPGAPPSLAVGAALAGGKWLVLQQRRSHMGTLPKVTLAASWQALCWVADDRVPFSLLWL